MWNVELVDKKQRNQTKPKQKEEHDAKAKKQDRHPNVNDNFFFKFVS